MTGNTDRLAHSPARGGDELREAAESAVDIWDEMRPRLHILDTPIGADCVFDALRKALASTDMAGAGEMSNAGEQFGVKSGESRQVFRQRIMQGRKCVAMADEPMASRIAVALTAHAPSPIAYDVRRLVIAARRATDSDGGASELSFLLDAVEAFSSRVPYEDEPDDMPAAPPVEGLTSGEGDAAAAAMREAAVSWLEASAAISRSKKHPADHPLSGGMVDGMLERYATVYEEAAKAIGSIPLALAASPKATATASVREAVEAHARWLDEISTNTDMAEIVADGGVTAGMVVQQEAREQRRRLLRALTDSGTAATIGGERA